ncbi:MAG: hypothetical protein O2944_01615, partial [Proteobacteria bacterium]|nr:hypothetical protein [Pseudomonadota bacterium]
MRFILIVAAALFALPASAQPTTAQTGTGKGTLGDLASVVFKEAEKRVIEEYFGKAAIDDDTDKDKSKGKDKKKHKEAKKGGDDVGKGKGHGRGKGLPPGLAKRDQLPPGLAKRGHRLPP